jgi:hypothetical protein
MKKVLRCSEIREQNGASSEMDTAYNVIECSGVCSQASGPCFTHFLEKLLEHNGFPGEDQVPFENTSAMNDIQGVIAREKNFDVRLHLPDPILDRFDVHLRHDEVHERRINCVLFHARLQSFARRGERAGCSSGSGYFHLRRFRG